MTYRELLNSGADILKLHDVPDSALDAFYLLEFVTGFTRSDMLLRGNEVVSDKEVEKFNGLVELRAKRIPLQHITGSQEFMGLPFKVNENVLIPRQDTEILVGETLKVATAGKRILDLCTGSGCVLISVLKLSDGTSGVGVDLSAEALSVAKENAALNEIPAEFVQSDLFTSVEGKFDIITSNPPYIRTDIIPSLMPEVKDHDPYMALDGGDDGLVFYRRIVSEAPKFLKDNGHLLVEIGVDQGEAVMDIFSKAEFTDVHITKDYSTNDRVVSGHL